MSDQAFQIIGWIVAILALGMLLAALFTDLLRQRFSRSKRRRCPKCWYDLSHTAGRTCSECGHAATHERSLFKSRRQWKLVGLAMILMLASYAVSVTPAVKQRGWAAAVPTPAMILVLPRLRPNRNCVMWNQSTNSGSWNKNASVPTWKELLFIDFVHRRFKEGSVGWLNDWFINVTVCDPKYTHKGDVYRWPTARDRFLASQRWSDGERISWYASAQDFRVRTVLRTRPRWPKHVPILAYAEVISNSGTATVQFIPQGEGYKRISRSDGPPPPIACGFNIGPTKWLDRLEMISTHPNDEFAYVIKSQLSERSQGFDVRRCLDLSEKSLNIPVEIVDSCDSILTKVISPEVEHLLSQFKPTVEKGHNNNLHVRLNGDKPLPSHHSHRDKMTLAFALTVQHHGNIVARGFAWFWNDRLDAISQTYVVVAPTSDTTVNELKTKGDWQLTLTADPLIALRNFDCNRYWDGEVTLPLEVR